MRFFLNPRYVSWLLALYWVQWLIWAYRPPFFQEWLLENVLPLLFVGLLVATFRHFPLSNISYTLIFVFMCLHTVGSHYTYSLVPYDRWASNAVGVGINELAGFERNHYDRLVHFSFGLLLAYPIREVFVRIAGVRGFWGYYLPLDLTMSFSMLYELIEWAVAIVFAGDIGQAYLGTQGDEWDAHKDMALATTGAIISMSVVWFINWKYNRNFGEELLQSLTVKDARPLGEVKLQEWIKDSQKED
ncbi:MAG: hypothetical protein A3F68_09615 [Acidobacteria bacterium RIFCSPLOWO2_12_FULL_54_10]|nr:MAG: hypothetical protein A3F68_09615 [Acidobacteria bacterium RIFCSPLOWO2_12_FULL_54_10]